MRDFRPYVSTESACYIIPGFFVGDWLAWQLAFPNLNGDIAWTNFGRLRPVHTTRTAFNCFYLDDYCCCHDLED